jgi:hypothetical protein
VGELEAVALAVEAGFPRARRAAPLQARDGEEAPDVTGVGDLWLEAKRHRKVPVARLARELLSVERPGWTAVLVHRDDGGPWLATLDARELLHRHRELLDLRAEVAALRAQTHRSAEGVAP